MIAGLVENTRITYLYMHCKESKCFIKSIEDLEKLHTGHFFYLFISWHSCIDASVHKQTRTCVIRCHENCYYFFSLGCIIEKTKSAT